MTNYLLNVLYDRIFTCLYVCLFAFFYYSAKVSALKHFLFMKTDMVNKYCESGVKHHKILTT
jgi:hypothetical protein